MPPRREAPPSAARAKRFGKLAAQVYGDDWRRALAAEMLVNDTTVSRWLRGIVEIPGAVFVALECRAREKG